ncbi:MAG: Asp23/Gls24 family envelope stress response protein [Eggerthellaceae bacterium]|nr:Asp23/Gls24 family envelope stress response protein [Eggerthellaceae bacterium]
MSGLNIEGMTIAPGVVETIISLAAREVDGVASIGPSTTSGIMDLIGGKPSTQGIEVTTDENDALHVSIRMEVKSGHVLPDLAAKVRQAVSDAAMTQVGVKVASVDIYIDGIQFDY